MYSPRNKYYLLNYVFTVAVITLILNDHYLKFTFANWLTGKLSDIAGIIMLPLLIVYFFPRTRHLSILISAALFIFWKSPFSQPFIDLYNTFTPLPTSRIVDYSDLSVLLLLPIPYLIIKRIDNWGRIKIHKLNPLVVILPAVLGLMATSPTPEYYYTRSSGNLQCYNCTFTVNYNQQMIIEKLKEVGIVFDKIIPVDSFTLSRAPDLKDKDPHFYTIHTLVLDNDTLSNLDLTMKTYDGPKTKIYFRGMDVAADLGNEKLANKLRKYYKQLVLGKLKNILAN